jgi:hypothetical protein
VGSRAATRPTSGAAAERSSVSSRSKPARRPSTSKASGLDLRTDQVARRQQRLKFGFQRRGLAVLHIGELRVGPQAGREQA